MPERSERKGSKEYNEGLRDGAVGLIARLINEDVLEVLDLPDEDQETALDSPEVLLASIRMVLRSRGSRGECRSGDHDHLPIKSFSGEAIEVLKEGAHRKLLAELQPDEQKLIARRLGIDLSQPKPRSPRKRKEKIDTTSYPLAEEPLFHVMDHRGEKLSLEKAGGIIEADYRNFSKNLIPVSPAQVGQGMRFRDKDNNFFITPKEEVVTQTKEIGDKGYLLEIAFKSGIRFVATRALGQTKSSG